MKQKLMILLAAVVTTSCVNSTDSTTKITTKSVDPAVLSASLAIGKVLVSSVQALIDAEVAKQVAKINPPAK